MQNDKSVNHVAELERVESQLKTNNDQIFELAMILESESRKLRFACAKILFSVTTLAILVSSIINPQLLGNFSQEFSDYFGMLCVFLVFLITRAFNEFFASQSIVRQVVYIIDTQNKAIFYAKESLLKEKEQSYG